VPLTIVHRLLWPVSKHILIPQFGANSGDIEVTWRADGELFCTLATLSAKRIDLGYGRDL